MSEQTIRSFIAVELPDDVKKELKRVQTELALDRYSFVKSVSPEGIHLTLKFLGGVPPQKIKDIVSVMEEANQGVKPFELQINEIGAFPNFRRPRVLWVGIKGDVDKLIAWQRRLDDGLVPLGFAKENRPFTPHLTLARLRENSSPVDVQQLGEAVSNSHVQVDYRFTVNTLSLMRSQLLPTGAVYSLQAEVKLKP
jgi:RNA 2',3'-cyclic 3'-phosphodiesterase